MTYFPWSKHKNEREKKPEKLGEGAAKYFGVFSLWKVFSLSRREARARETHVEIQTQLPTASTDQLAAVKSPSVAADRVKG